MAKLNSNNSIDIFPWNKHFDTGIASIDEQHKKLVQLLNMLASHIAFKSELPELNIILDELTNYTVYHFQDEEEIWNKFFPEDAMSEKHNKYHAKFISEIQDLKKQLGTSPTDEMLRTVVSFLTRWLIHHILESDQFMAKVVLALQSGLPMQAAKDLARKQMQGEHKALIDVILSIYETLSSNTLNLMREMSERKNAENIYHRIFDLTSTAMVIIEADGTLSLVNKTFINLVESHNKNVIGRPFTEFVDNNNIEKMKYYHTCRLQGKSVPESYTFQFITELGNKGVASLNAIFLEDVKQTILSIIDITAQEQSKFALQQANTQYLNLVENIGDKFVIYSHLPDGKITFASDSVEEVFGLKKDVVIGTQWSELINWIPEDSEATHAIVKQQIEGTLGFFQFRMSFIHPDNSLRTLHISNHPVRDELGEVTSIDGIVEDITERTKSEEKLELAASVFANAREGILITDASGIIIEVNETFSLVTGYSREEVIGQNPRILQSGLQSPEFYALMWQSLLEKKHWYGEVWNRHKGGEFYAELLTISAVENKSGQVQNYVALFSDITLIKKHQGQLEHIVHYDVLTNLPNRVLLADRLNQAIARSQRGHNSIAVIFLDLDGFKSVNDLHGHNIGDELLILVSKLMKDALREGDTLARIGGDEFVAVLPDLDKYEDYQQVLERLLLAASMPITIGEIKLQVSASIGVTLYPQDGADADILIRHADQAMYLAKQAGKNCYHLFDTEHDDAVNFRQESLNNISAALDRDEFILHYQPKVNMVTSEVVGVEALIRWQHPSRGLVPPLDFLPIIEDHAISLDIGEWVIETALSQISQWQKMGITLPISINISAYQLQQSNFVTRLSTLLAAHKDVSPQGLELEILETSVLEDVHHTSTIMDACIALGVNFALDDFGTGYSSLTHLRRLPANLIKIDQTFVRDMLHDADDLAIIEGVIALAKSFKRDVIAEGVETVEHGTALLEVGCELAQGYGIAKPMSASDISLWMKNWKSDVSWQNSNKDRAI
jgi:diguanylate cyclase (GGDEF)-like protein/hemerythrin-like metal-binding protein/PAS domain S-box-containing protein